MTKEEAKEKFRMFCVSEGAKEIVLEDCDWCDLSIGYFLALGMSIDEANDLALDVRYKEHYWC